VLGVPSSALEVVVLSTARLGTPSALVDRIVGLTLHLLGHVWGLEHGEGPMQPPEDPTRLRPHFFTQEQWTTVMTRLIEAADMRIEEEGVRWRRLAFYWRTLRANPSLLDFDSRGVGSRRQFDMVGIGKRNDQCSTCVGIVHLLGAECE